MKHKLIIDPRFVLSLLLASVIGVARADVNVALDIGHGYDFYYPSLSLSASSPDPVTYHRVESPSGLLWKNCGTNTDANAFFITNSLDAVLNECNGEWKLYLNKGDGSEQLYHFTVSIAEVTTNSLGDVTIIYPADGSSGVPAQRCSSGPDRPIWPVSISTPTMEPTAMLTRTGYRERPQTGCRQAL